MIVLKATGCEMMSVNSISRMSPGAAPLTKTGPVSGCIAPTSSDGKSATVVAGPSCPSSASRVSQRHLFALADLDDRRDVRVEPVVAEVGLVREPLCAIDTDRMHDASS
jgi:hypothetical protein